MIICLSALAALLVLVVAGVTMLYRGDSASKGQDGISAETARKTVVAKYPLMQAVPADAAMLMYFDNAEEAISILTDTTLLFRTILTDAPKTGVPQSTKSKKKLEVAKGFAGFTDAASITYLGALKGSPVVISMHYSGELVPLMILDAGHVERDTLTMDPVLSPELKALLAAADSAKIKSKVLDCTQIAGENVQLKKDLLIAFSPSEALVTSSQRHLEGGMSILDKDSFSEAAVAGKGEDLLLISNDYASKLMVSHLIKPYTSYYSFFNKLADWTALAINKRDFAEVAGSKVNETTSIEMTGRFSCPSNNPTYFANVWGKTAPADAKAWDVIPSQTLFAVTVPISDVEKYIESYNHWLDGTGALDKHKRAIKVLKDSVGIAPEQWAKSLDIKELVKVDLPIDKDVEHLLFIRPGKNDSGTILRGTEIRNLKEAKTPFKYIYKKFASTLFGDIFSIPDESSAIFKDGWLIVGNEAALSALPADNLKTMLSQEGVSVPNKGVNMVAYYSAAARPSDFPSIFRPAQSIAMSKTLSGVSQEYAFFYVKGTDIAMDVDRIAVRKSKDATKAIRRDTVVVVPEGPFKVKNAATGKMNIFGQAANGALSMREEDGKGLWSIPFNGKLCGYAEAIDYYGNGKLQYLFASGSKLYLIDRLGRFVGGFPVDLGKEIVLGPAVYDFTGAHGYRAMVLHKDNTLGLYNLHGAVSSGWKGITAESTIKTLPELIKINGASYWIVRTSDQLMIFPFHGGDPVVSNTGDKAIRPDSQVTVDGKNIKAICMDGKERTFKIK